MWKTVDLFRCVFYYQNCAPKSVFVGREAESPFPTEVQELSWMLQRAIRGGLTPWEQYRDKDIHMPRMVMTWHSHGFREANSNYKRVIHLQYLPGRVGSSVSHPFSGLQGLQWDTRLGRIAPTPYLTGSSCSGPWGCCSLGPAHCCRGGPCEHMSLHSWEKFLGGKAEQKKGAGHQTGCKDSTRFGRVLESIYFLYVSLGVCLSMHLILSIRVVSHS